MQPVPRDAYVPTAHDGISPLAPSLRCATGSLAHVPLEAQAATPLSSLVLVPLSLTSVDLEALEIPVAEF
jgi:hypothetical protein